MNAIHLAWDALFLDEAAYAEAQDRAAPVLFGLKVVVAIAVAVALVGLIGTALEWATTPAMDEIKVVVLEGLQEMSWYQEMESDPEFHSQFERWYDWGWRIFPPLFGAPNLLSAGLRILLLPLGLLLTWLVYGVLAHVLARLLGGQAALGQTLGCTALAVAPQLLGLITLVPYATVAGGLSGIWVLLCRYKALKTSHQLTWSRALAATLLPYAAFALVVALFGCATSTAIASIAGGGAQ